MESIRPVRFEDAPLRHLAGIRRWHTHAGAAESIPAQWAEFTTSPLFRSPTPGCVTFGVLCAAREDAFEYMTAVEVESFANLDPTAGRMRIPALHFAIFEHEGPVAGIHHTWRAIWEQWIPTSGLKPVHAPEFERYDHRYQRATRDGIVEIWTPVTPV
jgi:AraC family transcriptional regulator